MFLDISLQFLADTFLGLLLIILLLIFVVLYYSFYLFKKLIHLLKWSLLIDKKVAAAIVYGDDEHKNADVLVQLPETSSFRNLFLEKLVESDKKFSGAAEEEINKLFRDYNLEKEALKKLNQKKYYLIAGGIQELSSMQVVGAVPKIESFLGHPSPLVYQEAQYAMANFKGFEGLRFLDTVTSKISEWQQLRLLLSVPNIPADCGATILQWLKSENESVIIFTLRLAKKFQMLSFYPEILNLMAHPSAEVRIQTVQTLLSLENEATMSHFINAYRDQPEEVQVEMLRALSISKDPRSVGFLKEQLLSTSSPKLKIYAAEALFELGYHNYLTALKEEESSPEELIQIINHATQEKIW